MNDATATKSPANYSSAERLAVGITIVHHLCAGKSQKEIEVEMGLTQHHFSALFDELRLAAHLPKEKKAYQACGQDVQANIKRFVQHLQAKIELLEIFEQSQVKFAF